MRWESRRVGVADSVEQSDVERYDVEGGGCESVGLFAVGVCCRGFVRSELSQADANYLAATFDDFPMP